LTVWLPVEKDNGIDKSTSCMMTGDHYYGEAAPSKDALGRKDVFTSEHRAHARLQPEVGPSSAQRPSLGLRVDDAQCAASFPCLHIYSVHDKT
jgi:hypothetical protein